MHRRRRRQSNVVLSVCILHLPAIYATPSMVQGSRAKRAFPFLPPLWDFQLSRRGCCLPSAGSVGLSTVHLAGAAEPATTQVKTLAAWPRKPAKRPLDGPRHLYARWWCSLQIIIQSGQPASRTGTNGSLRPAPL
ncbi:hypothetical protein IWZ00DRAFT_216728 [Phyllosticta capitalensis]|uniref:uncharacterized protein n=1 Tax=Phyllosticta capitalensis TaxID=121624 RepID=UPI0031320C88